MRPHRDNSLMASLNTQLEAYMMHESLLRAKEWKQTCVSASGM